MDFGQSLRDFRNDDLRLRFALDQPKTKKRRGNRPGVCWLA
jgi:hypothetical protein